MLQGENIKILCEKKRRGRMVAIKLRAEMNFNCSILMKFILALSFSTCLPPPEVW